MNDKTLTDSEYIAGIAEHYKGKGIAEFEQHHARLTAIAARLAADQQKGGGCNCEVSAGLAAFHKDDCRAMAPQPSIPAPAQHAPAFQRWSMTKGSDGARWSVYMDHDPCGEWVKWIEVQQHCFGIALAQQDGKASGWDVQRIAQWLYDDHCANQNSIHCNRFPSYAELSEGGRKKWMDKAHAIASLTKDQQP